MSENLFLQGLSLEEFWQQHEARTKAVVLQVIAEFNRKTEKEQMLSSKEVCKLLRITTPTLNSYCKAGKIRKLKIGARVLFNKAEVEEALHKIQPLKKSA